MKPAKLTRLAGCLLLAAAVLLRPTLASAADADGAPTLIVFAAASLTDALQELSADFGKSSAIKVKPSFAASSALARQIESGAPADIFFSADLEWMDYLEQRKLIREGSRHDLLGNHLVLIAPARSPLDLTIEPGFGLAEALGKGRLATGDPDSVPAGRYARAALTSLGVWNSVASRLAPAESVRAALALVDRAEVPLGIVYETDALIDKAVRIVGVFPEDTHPPITYPIALTVGAKVGAADFVAYLRTPQADAVFRKYGFVPLHR